MINKGPKFGAVNLQNLNTEAAKLVPFIQEYWVSQNLPQIYLYLWYIRQMQYIFGTRGIFGCTETIT